MIHILDHRGPDGQAIWREGRAVLAHARLAVIDTSAAADQPMHDEVRGVHIVFNGEIYNFRELRRELEGLGYRFRTQGDTEVILYGYSAWGKNVFRRLTGMFSIALWDARKDTLVVARDRFGEKPLYYAERPEGFFFASEIKALLTWPGMPRRPDMEQVHDYLTFGFSVGPGTIYQGIRRLPAAHILTLEGGRPPTIEPYWDLPSPAEQKPVDVEDAKAELIERLAASVKGCLISDVPLGAFLSGGVDSSAVVAMMAARGGVTDIKTFSSGFGFGDFDETEFAAMVAVRYGTDHHPFRFGVGLLAEVSKLAWFYDEPFSDSSAVVAYALARETRKHVTVALTGDGADETFLGYARYFNYGDAMRRSPPDGQRRLASLYIDSLAPSDARRAASDAYGFFMERFRENQKLRGYDFGILAHLTKCSYDRFLPYVIADAAPEELAARLDCKVYLPDDLLVKVDVASMAHSLETRAPFLNHELAEWAARIPTAQRVWNREGKALLKSALEPYLPHACMYRTKVGFRVPVREFVRKQAAAQTDALLLSDRFFDRGIIAPGYVQQILDEHRSGKTEHGTRIWALLMLELWYRTWIDSDSNDALPQADDPFAELQFTGSVDRFSGDGDEENETAPPELVA